MDSAPIRVILADDQVLFVESLRRVIEALDPSILIVAVVYDGKEAVERALSLRPDIVILDVRMPLMDGVKAAKLIHEGNPKSKLIMLTTFDDDDYFYEALGCNQGRRIRFRSYGGGHRYQGNWSCCGTQD
jgi:YesN/AraC family two-component response regulator